MPQDFLTKSVQGGQGMSQSHAVNILNFKRTNSFVCINYLILSYEMSLPGHFGILTLRSVS